MHRLSAVLLLAAVGLGGCGGGERTARETAAQWIAAVNAEDWSRACELSVWDAPESCRSVLAERFPISDGPLRLERFNASEDGRPASFTVEEPPGFEPTVERHDGAYRVHFEVMIIR